MEAAAIGGALMTAACTGSPTPVVPDPAPGMRQPDELAFGDAIEGRASRALLRVLDAVEPRFGRVADTQYYVAPAAAAGTLRAHYDARARAAGWTPLAGVGADPALRSDAVAYVQGKAAFAVVWLLPREGLDAVPVYVARFGV